MEVTVEAVISFIGLFLAINALAIGPALYFLQKTERTIEDQNRQLLDQIRNLDRTTKFTMEMVDSVISALRQLSVGSKVNTGLIDAGFAKKEIDQERLAASRKKLEGEQERAFNELMAFSPDNQIRLSSFRQLSQVYGNWHSIAKMEQSLDYVPSDKDMGAVLQICVLDLKKRLNHC